MEKYSYVWASKQRRRYDCGITCVLNISRYYGKMVTRADFKDLLKSARVKKNGTSMYDLIKKLAIYGIEAQAIKCNSYSFVGNELCPLILFVETISGNGHYIIVYEVQAGIVTIADPSIWAARISRLSINKFNKRYKWQGEAILINSVAD